MRAGALKHKTECLRGLRQFTFWAFNYSAGTSSSGHLTILWVGRFERRKEIKMEVCLLFRLMN